MTLRRRRALDLIAEGVAGEDATSAGIAKLASEQAARTPEEISDAFDAFRQFQERQQGWFESDEPDDDDCLVVYAPGGVFAGRRLELCNPRLGVSRFRHEGEDPWFDRRERACRAAGRVVSEDERPGGPVVPPGRAP